jgi:hypothetical protein
MTLLIRNDEPTPEAIYRLLGLARKAGRLVLGADTTESPPARERCAC